MHYLVTGGAGFIGSALAAQLIATGHRVTVLDDLSSGSRRNVHDLMSKPEFRLVVASCADRDLMSTLIADCDRIFHLAAIVGVKRVLQSPAAAIRSNYDLAACVLAIATEFGRPVFFASSSEVYGKSGRVPYREDDDLVLGRPTVARWSYACSKALLEFLAIATARERGLPTVIGRFFNTVGPRQSSQYGMVLPTFVAQALSGAPITVHGDGDQTRAFVHVRDVVRAIIMLAEQPNCRGEVFNIGSEEEISIAALARRVRDLCDSRSEVIHIACEQAYGTDFEESRRRVPDTTKLKAATNWSVTASLDEIIAEIAAHARSHINA